MLWGREISREKVWRYLTSLRKTTTCQRSFSLSLSPVHILHERALGKDALKRFASIGIPRVPHAFSQFRDQMQKKERQNKLISVYKSPIYNKVNMSYENPP